jgi:hypothetical protein
MNAISRKILMTLCCVVLFSGITMRWTNAQSGDTRWSSVERLSTESGMSSQGYMASDPYGYVHVFWSESDAISGRPMIQYSRFDGETWSPPNDIFAGNPDSTIVFISPYVDHTGLLHLLWSEGNTGPVFYSNAPAQEAGSAKAWLPKRMVTIPAFWGKLRVDSQGIVHVLYSDFYGELPGVYYLNTSDQGLIWSTPVWLDPDIPEGVAPTQIEFGIDQDGGLHALWEYMDPSIGNIHSILYANSFDGGATWSDPFLIDEADESSEELRSAYPEFIVNGRDVHVIWAGDSQVRREHRYSRDAGQHWSNTNRIMGDLAGQALGGGLSVDSQGRVHYAVQVRSPVGIYHTIWDGNSWSIPELFYFISEGGGADLGDRIHAHNVRLAIRAGNQLVVTFTSAPGDPQLILYAMHRTLNDVPALQVLPTPVPTQTTVPSSTPILEEGPLPTATLSPELLLTASQQGEPIRRTTGLVWGIIPSLLLLIGVMVFRMLQKR